MATKRRIDVSVGMGVVFTEAYPMYGIDKGRLGTVNELIGDTHANVVVEMPNGNTKIAVPVADLGEITLPVTE